MHSNDPNKPWDKFRSEIQAILEGTSQWCPKDLHDFRRFVFTQDATFAWARFTQDADFLGATFTQNAHFSGATFTQNADFRGARFTQGADFYFINVAGVLDFRSARIGSNAQVLLHGVNKANEIEVPDLEAPPTPSGELPKKKIPLEGLRLRLRNVPLEWMRFEDVRWYGQRGPRAGPRGRT